MYLRIGFTHTSHMCLESPSHRVVYGYEIDFWDQHYFIKWFFLKEVSLYVLPYYTQKYQYILTTIVFENKKRRFSRKWGKTWKFETKILMEKIFFLHLVQKSACLAVLLSSKLVFAMRPIYRIWDTMNFALEIRFSVFFVLNGGKRYFFHQNRIFWSQYVPSSEKMAFKNFSDNPGHNNWNISRVCAKHTLPQVIQSWIIRS